MVGVPSSVAKYRTAFESAESRDLRGHTGKVNSVKWNCDGRRVASGSADKTARIWTMERSTLRESTELRGHQGSVSKAVWDPDHPDKLATASVDCSVRLWDVRAHRSPSHTIQTKGENINMCWSPDSRCIAVGNRDDLITFIDPRGGTDGEGKKTYIWHTLSNEHEINELDWNYAGDLLFLTTGEGTVKIIEFPSFKTVHSFKAHTANAYCIEFDPRGRYFATGGADAIVALWDIETLTSLQTFSRLDWPIRALSFSFDGDFIVYGSDDKCIDISHVESGEHIFTLKTNAAINSLAWHPTKHILAYATDGSDHNGRPASLQVFGFNRQS
ncbi:hypothetical protein BATDEDRAFT_90779 [Batrachochytrium dendrobatidis JAM81]|uniref:Uncharacterized protein n=2 Tax=Batrachochytrium dendrobatidis TaxID=109871 RepID=F4P959_BATDJ|nr:uncharacterized protein BATDEDRAFT_90779 [Batrachochytrium dendrobatidis JAM81]EGF78122.1 hypothetical protein BATDEDRAFT_90779 [Batrachochytrium dendrobatidis JAM81]KAJ8331229.1 hypothetical protein O5D80_000789 [Batrachochytrium dendrobatidis]KAK5667615.1 hypothetical protein QVD99_005731 [Batrachochytrium dendrobatidis]|eukprot:XP_006681205.1 hypothetical protein BATDEDRAFT_90779 [Batrachochytrium dendrobatidis JAM81]